MASATLTRDGPRGHVRAIPLAGAASLLVGVASSLAQGTDLPFCPVYPPGHAPAIGPSNCVPAPEALWGPPTALPEFATLPAAAEAPSGPKPAASDGRSTKTAAPLPDAVALGPVQRALVKPAAPPAPAAPVVQPPAPQTTVALQTPGAITLDQVAAMLGPLSRRAVTFNLSAADAYKRSDLTHRVRLTWSGTLQALVDQLGQIYGLDVAMDDTAIRFSSRQRTGASDVPTTRTP